MRTLIILFFLLVHCGFQSQNIHELDSLEKAYPTLTTDSARFANLKLRIKIYRLGDPAKALTACWEAYDLSKKSSNESNMARALFNLAVQYRKIGNYDSSVVLYLDALRLFEKKKEEDGATSCYGSLGIVYWQQGDFAPALKYLRKSLAATQKSGDKENECSNLNNIGGVFNDMKQYDSSLHYLHLSLAISEQRKDTVGLADNYGNMGGVYLLKGDTNNAFKFSLLGEKYARLSGNTYQLCTSLGTIAQILASRKKFDEAEKYSLMALDLAGQLGSLEAKRGSYKLLAELYKGKGSFDKATQYLERYIAANDSLISEARMKQITDLDAKYQSAKKDKDLITERAASERKSILLYALVGGLALVLGLAFFVYRGYRIKKKYLGEIVLAKKELEIKSTELELKNNDITDSINYAKKIQLAVLPNLDHIYKNIPGAFVLYKPKDIVSGDFFWFHEIDADNYILVCGDCTGHGVPGALMTIIGSNLLNQVIIENKIYSPSAVLLQMDRLLNMTLKQGREQFTGVQDGMDLSLLKVNKRTREIIVSTAKRPFIFIRNNVMQDFKGNKYSLGGMQTGEKIFEEIKLEVQHDDQLYFFTDGYVDQFGGDKGKKFSSKRLKDLFLSIHELPVEDQKNALDKEITKWTGNLEQVDDICVIGIRF